MNTARNPPHSSYSNPLGSLVRKHNSHGKQVQYAEGPWRRPGSVSAGVKLSCWLKRWVRPGPLRLGHGHLQTVEPLLGLVPVVRLKQHSTS